MSRAGRGRWFAAHALLPTGLARDVSFTARNGVFTEVQPDSTPSRRAERLPGVALPGLANGHSHAFHRALRARTHDSGGTFWTWRKRMYSVAAQLDPDSYLQLARATYAEMALAGYTCVGEFHYLHNDPRGIPYADDAMGQGLVQAAAEAGIRLTLLDTCYLRGGLTQDGHIRLEGTQVRFGDGTVEAWANRVSRLRPGPGARIAAAIHSVRAVPRELLGDVARVAEHGVGKDALGAGMPLHVHLSEQPAENEACLEYYGRSPTELLAEEGVLSERTTAVHATHLSDNDIRLLARHRTTVCLCPTTERDLADGIGPARALADAGCGLSLGSDQNAVIDPFEEARGLESHERLATQRRGRFSQSELLGAAANHASLGWSHSGELAVGRRADLVAVRTDSPRTAGIDRSQVLMAATAADVDTVVVDGVQVVTAGRHRLGDVARLLDDAIGPLWDAVGRSW